MSRRFESGATKRKKKEQTLLREKESLKKITKLDAIWKVEEPKQPVPDENPGQHAPKNNNEQNQPQHPEEICLLPVPKQTQPVPFVSQPDFQPLSDDPAEWQDLTTSDKQRCDYVMRRPIPLQLEIDFPHNDKKRRFTNVHYFRVMTNGERVRRTWLVYSLSKDVIFCVCCKLFGTGNIPLRLGSNTWEGLSKKLKDHESGFSHQECLTKWVQLRQGIHQQNTIDVHEQQLFLKEKEFWRNVLKRLVDITLFLAERNLAFRGSEEILGSKHNGNFLGLFELMAKYDPPLEKLHERVNKKETKYHYLSKESQNEFIQLIAKAVEDANVKAVKEAKYFSTILDCTPDISHQEQMSIVLRFVECSPGIGIHVREAFFGYIVVHDTSGKGKYKCPQRHVV